ncbi:MAG: 16S rRNA (uracil(1498)-N(3))-methyltransferase [Fimbriimonadaceae bacterium]|nr:16S rRNA (uracil(1498)-N(3))-methyltransferase [Fimbriimonadaceae bacterium]
MGRRDLPPLRSLPRVFVPGATPEAPIPLPAEEVDKLRKVLRLRPGDPIAVLPDDGTLIRCEFLEREAHPVAVERVDTEATRRVTLVQALPKGDRMDDIVRSCTELGVARFVLFHAERSVVRWEGKKLDDRLRRLRVIAREACEQCFRTRQPVIETARDLRVALERFPEAIVFSESEAATTGVEAPGEEVALVVGPEGGWAPRELALIGDRGRTLGPRVLRVDTAAIAVCAWALLDCLP